MTLRQHVDPRLLWKFVNSTDPGQQLLLLVWVISCFIPGFPHPILNIYGAQGSAKSLLCKILRKVIEPSAIEVSGFPREARELAQFLYHHWISFFDNVSQLPEWVSDMLCKAVSGEGFSKRQLFSDQDDTIFVIQSAIAINGINLVASKPDLLERSIIFELERVPEGQRRQEEDLFRDFEQDRAQIVGGILDTIATAMRIKPSVRLDSLPRMADFTVWGCAIAEALGYPQEAFLNAYYANIRSQNEMVLGESLIATAVRALLDEEFDFEGTPSDLLTALTDKAQELGINTEKERAWPKAANTLSRRLNELKTNLAADGIRLGRTDKDRPRRIVLRKDPENTVATDIS